MSFSTFSSPNPILYGVGTSSQIGERLKQLCCKKAVVIHDKGIKEAGIIDKITGYIAAAGIEYVCYDGVIADVPDYSVNKAADFAISEKVDSIVAVGGGSSLDTGKAVRLMLSYPPPISNFYSRPGMPPQTDYGTLNPLFVLPTTSGTGSEASPGGVIIDTENNAKEHVMCPITLGIVDPELTLAMPPAVTAMTAFDALGHSIEAVTSGEPNAFSELLGLKAISLIAENLPIVLKDGKNLEARGGMQLAATMAMMSILGPFCNIPHDMGLEIGMEFGMPHGVAVTVALPECLEFIAPAIPERLAKVARALGADVPDGSSAEAIGTITSKTVRDLMNNSVLPSLKKYVKSKEEFLAVIPRIMASQDFHFSPRPATEADIRAILSKAYDAAKEAD